MQCREARTLFSPYLDGAVSGVQMQALQRHMEGCAACAREYQGLFRVQSLLHRAGPRKAPPDMAMRLRAALAQERARRPRARFENLRVHLENALNPLAFHAAAGICSALLCFGILIGFFAVPATLQANDVPLVNYTPPRLEASPFSDDISVHGGAPVVVEAYVGADGRVSDYRLLSGPDDAHIRADIDNALLFTTFEPARSFGHPAPGHVVLSFSGVSVQG